MILNVPIFKRRSGFSDHRFGKLHPHLASFFDLIHFLHKKIFSFRSCDLPLSSSLYTWSFLIEVKSYNIMPYVQFPKNDILKSIKLDLPIGFVARSKCISKIKRKKIILILIDFLFIHLFYLIFSLMGSKNFLDLFCRNNRRFLHPTLFI